MQDNSHRKRILVTGGAGFIGSHLVAWLVAQNHYVRVLDNMRTGHIENLAPLISHIDMIEGDICNRETVQAAMHSIDLVFHLAALVSVQESLAHPLRAHDITATGTWHVLEAARQAGVQRVAHMSSAAVYGNPAHIPVCETTPLQPLSPYAATKIAAEQAGMLYTRIYGLETVALRGFNVYGPRQDPNSAYASVIPRFLAALAQGQQPVIYGDGQQTRDFIFVGDMVQAFWAAATTPGIAGGVYNVGGGQATSILELLHMLSDVTDKRIAPQFAPARSGEVRHSRADVTLFTTHTGFRATTGLYAGLEATVNESLML